MKKAIDMTFLSDIKAKQAICPESEMHFCN